MIHVDRRHGRFIIPALLAAMVAAPGYGQAIAVAEVQGEVSDASGAAVPGARIKMTQAETQYSRNTTSAAGGAYSFPNLPVGPYTLEVTADGFKTHVQSGIVLQVGSGVQVNVILQVGSISE